MRVRVDPVEPNRVQFMQRLELGVRVPPAMRELAEFLQFVGIDVQDAREGAARFMERYGVRYPSVFDPNALLGIPQGVFGPPATLFYAAAGTLSTTIPGQLSDADLDRGLAKIAPDLDG